MTKFVDPKDEKFSLSLSQKNIWDLEQAFPGTSINNISTTIRIDGRLDFSCLQKSIQSILSSDVSLRTRLCVEEGIPRQYCVPYEEEMFPVYDFSLTTQRGIEAWEMATTREVIPLLSGPLYRFVLFRTGENSGGVLIKIHHIISDGWSQVLLCNRIAQTYLDLLSGKEPHPEQSPSYQLHVQEEQEYLSSEAYEKDRLYWEDVLQTAGEPSVIKPMKSAAISPVGCRRSFRLPQMLNHQIYSFCLENRVAPFAVFYMALAIYFKRMGGAGRFTIGVPIFNRTNFTARQTTGMFVSTLPFFNELCDDWTFSEFNEHLAECWYDLLRHQRFPYEDISRLAERFQHDPGRLFHIALSYQDSKIFETKDASVTFSGRWHYGGYQSEQLCIHLSNLEDHKRYSVDYDYLTQFLSEREIEELHTCLINILQEALQAPDRPIRSLSVLRPENREEVLYGFNRTARPVYEKNLYGRFSGIVREYPSRAALISQGKRVTYLELDHLAGRVCAAVNAAAGGEKGEILGAVFLPRGVPLFAAMSGLMRAGAAFLLLSTELPELRIRGILSKSGARMLLSTPEILQKAHLEGIELPVVDMESLPQEEAPARDADPQDLAYVVYTSGSTGEPKGVEICQKSLLNLAQAMKPIYGKSAILSVCNVGFDAFLLESAAALLCGRTIVLPEEGEQESPQRLAKLILGYGIGFLSVTPSRLAAFLKNGDFWNAMRSMESILCGGEAFPGDLLQRLQLCTGARIYNQYGPSETTVGVSLKLLNGSSAITVGKPMDNCRMYVLDEWMNPLPTGVYGSLYVGGLCVGRGYRNAPELTAQSFLDNPFENGERLYRTGDVACWTQEGEILLAGRMDRQVKLRGLRIEPQEVSACLASHPCVKDAAAKVFEWNGQGVLAAYYTAESPVTEAELLSYAASYLPRYMVPSTIQRLESIPLTPNGKVDESRLPSPEGASGKRELPASRTQEKVLEIFRRVLEQKELPLDGDYFLFGGNSLNAMEALGEIEREFGKLLRVSDLYACRTARRVGEYVAGEAEPETEKSSRRLCPAPLQERYPLSPMQQGIYVQCCLNGGGMAYHMPGAFRFGKKPDQERLKDAFCALIFQDEIFRTSFSQEEDGVFARIEENVSFELPLLSAGSFGEAWGAFLRPFDLGTAPLLRAALWEEEKEGVWYLLLDMHHMIGDGMSTPLVLRRLDEYYRGVSVSTPQLGYKDYAWELSQNRETPVLDYWKSRLLPLPEPIDLPVDFPRPHAFDFQGGAWSFGLSQQLSKACDACCEKNGITPFMLFLAAFGLLLAGVSRREDLVVGTPVSGRLKPELREICGPFINTLPLRIKPEQEKPQEEYLREIREEVTGLLDHQQAALEDIVSMLELPRTLSQNPLYQVLFSMRPLDADAFLFDGEPLRFLPVPSNTAKLDLSLEASKESGLYSFHFEYASSIFSFETIQLYGRSLETILRGLTSGNAEHLGRVERISPRDKIELWETPNHLFTPYVNLPIHKLIAAQAAIRPDETAVISHGKAVTYEGLEKRAGEIAGLLVQSGVKAGDRIALAHQRDEELIAALLGILRAGAVYVPILSAYPEQRIRYILENSGASVLLCDDVSKGKLPDGLPCKVLSLSGAGAPFSEDVPVGSEDLIYVLYTSGSTGQPKGVMIQHRAISNLFGSVKALMAGLSGPFLCTTNVIFDTFITETMLPLAMGLPVVMADDEEMLLPWKLAEMILQYHAEMMQFTPSRLQLCLGNDAFAAAAGSLKWIILMGEALDEQLYRRFRSLSAAAVVNMYGPTEAAVYVTAGEVTDNAAVTIGRPMRNCRVYVLDEAGRPVMPTARGELYLAGDCLAKGYIGRDDLTEKAFLPDPFFPGERMYRSGDIGRLRVDGTIDFLGRTDAQVKVNGLRVELGEITGAVLNSGLAKQAVTLVLPKPEGAKELCVFYVPEPDHPANSGELTAHLRALLPEYMVPSRIFSLEEMLYTPTGKADLPALRALAEQGGPKPTAKPVARPAPQKRGTAPAAAETLLGIWSTVLGEKDLSPDVSFFEQGGTSLAALNVLSRYFNRGLTVTLTQFYENPTARAQAALLSGKEDPGAEKESADKVREKTRYPSHVPALSESAASLGEKLPGRVLLTGATGFLGAHVLRSLLEAGAEKIVCVLRDGDAKRLSGVLSWYFGSGWASGASGSLEVVRGDVSMSGLGMEPREYGELSQRIDSVYHCAADVRHYVSDSKGELEVNTLGTETVLAFARRSGAVLNHISTVSVSGEYLVDSPEKEVSFTENDFDIGQDWQDNIYIKSKFLAENKVFEAVENGMIARVFRVGRLVGRTSDGVFQRNPENNAFYLVMRGVSALGAVTESMASAEIDLTPVDECADKIVALRNTSLTVCHVMASAPCRFERAARVLVPRLRVVPDEEFTQLLDRGVKDGGGDRLASLIDFWNRFRSGPISRIHPTDAMTKKQLGNVGFSETQVRPERLLRSFGESR